MPEHVPRGRPRRRRSFSQRNLAVEQEGATGELLAGALQVPPESGYELTHAFHPYPGRFHYRLPRTVLSAIARPGERVLDPFMGGGTTLVEACLLGLAALGNDLNPVALLVARERTRPRRPEQARRVLADARRIAAQVEALRREKQPPRLQHPRLARLRSQHRPHLFAELAQWYRLIEAIRHGATRETLRAVFSSAVVKFSVQAADSDPTAQPTSYPKGAASRFLVQKADQLLRAQVAFGERLPAGMPPVQLFQEDARLLPSLGWGAVQHVLTSPPYPGTYTYHEQHRLRMDWLDLDEAPFAAGEIGAPGSEAGWSDALRDTMGTLARVLAPGGNLFVVMGDWIAGGHPVNAATMLSRTAGAKDWQLAGRASVQRDAFSHAERKAFAKRGKWEHLLHFTRPGAPASGDA